MEFLPKKIESASNLRPKLRILELDCLRGISVLVVVLHHYTFAYDYHFKLFSDNKFYLFYGNLAVQLFFIISGFVIFLTLENCKKPLDFIVSRFSRLYPAYWAAMLTTIVVITIFPVPTLGKYTIKEIAINFTMLQGFFKGTRLIDQVYWTLKLELLFYGIMFLIFISKSLKKIDIFCLVWLAISITSCYVVFPLKKYIDVLLILSSCPLFIAGISFYKIKSGKNGNMSHVLILLGFIVECCWLLKTPGENYGSLVVLGFIYLIFYIFAYRGLPFLINKFFLFFGAISYSLYLVHNVIGYSIIYNLRKLTDTQFIYVSIPIVISILLAVLINKFIEIPVMNRIRKYYRNAHS